MSSLTAPQRAKLAHVSKTEIGAGKIFKITGNLAAFEYFGWIPDAEGATMALNGIDRTVTRPAGKRSRWLGDTVGTSYGASNANVSFYPSKRGNATPGEPIRIANIDEVNPITGEFYSATFSISGPIGAFLAWYIDNPPSFDSQVYSKSGKAYIGTVDAAGVGP